MAVRRDKNWRNVQTQLNESIKRSVATSAVVVQTEIKEMLSRPGRGRFYARNARTRRESSLPFHELTPMDVQFIRFQSIRNASPFAPMRSLRQLGIHRASKPGDPPAVDTGHLRRSIQSDMSRLSMNIARVGTNVKYARTLEFGGLRIAPRPYMRRATRAARAKVLQAFRNNLSRLGRVT